MIVIQTIIILLEEIKVTRNRNLHPLFNLIMQKQHRPCELNPSLLTRCESLALYVALDIEFGTLGNAMVSICIIRLLCFSFLLCGVFYNISRLRLFFANHIFRGLRVKIICYFYMAAFMNFQ